MTGWQRICRLHGEVKAGTVTWRWDYANECPVLATEMPMGSERWQASERAKWA